jgi:broad specificity phosphatase PhoE
MAKKIMIIRHGEKPDDVAHGVDPEGEKNKHDLSPQGWQRSGGLIRFFNPLHGLPSNPALAKPDAIFAAGSEGHAQSLRSQHTVEALAESLGLKVNAKHIKGDEKQLVKSVLATPGVVLIAWEHKAIVEVANLILDSFKASPQHWPDTRFDLVWVFDETPQRPGWKFSQVAQMLLPKDQPHVL